MAQSTNNQPSTKSQAAAQAPKSVTGPATAPKSTLSGEKLKALETAVSAIEKQFGKGSIMRLGENNIAVPSVDVVPTGSLGLDIALGIGGLPRGRIIEIFGPESSGKTTLTLHAVAECQKKGGVCAFVDAEHAIDLAYARNLGVNTEDLLISQPDTGEEALEIVDALIRSGVVDMIVVDSVAALTPKAEIEGNMGDSHMGLQARLMSQALRKLTGTISKSKSILVFINQIRMKIGVMFGNPETTTGGNALKFYSSLRLDIRRMTALKQGEEVVGSRTVVKVVKNKVAAPFKRAEFDILFGQGISRLGEVVDLASELDVIDKSGAWYSYKDQKIGQGRENVMQFFKENPSIQKSVEEGIFAKLNLKRDELAASRSSGVSPAVAAAAVAEARKKPA